MLINDKARMACSALVDHLDQPIRIEPLTKFPLVRDLSVDRQFMFDSLKRVKAWIPIDGSYDLGEGPRVSPQVQAKGDRKSTRLNSSHGYISYAVFCLKKKKIKEMTRTVRAEADLFHQQTQTQSYGSSHIGATAKDISNVVTDRASGVVDIFHGIDKAVADTWNNFWKDGKADGIGSNLFFF